MKKRTLTVGSILVAVICLILILWQIFGFLIINSNGSRSVVIDDNNRKVIEQLISKNIETDETLPDMDNAINIEWQTLMHKDQIVINYGEEDDFVFYITNRYENTLIEYIKDNGKVVYFESNEFIIDVVKILIYSFLLIIAIIIFVKQKLKISRKFIGFRHILFVPLSSNYPKNPSCLTWIFLFFKNMYENVLRKVKRTATPSF